MRGKSLISGQSAVAGLGQVVGLTVMVAALSACAPDLGPNPSVKAPATYATTRSFEAPNAAWPTDQWWKAYGDAQLDKLVEEALTGSPTLAQAETRVRRALTVVDQADSARLPQIYAEGSAQEQRQSLNLGYPDSLPIPGVTFGFKDVLPHGWHDTGRLTLNLEYQLDFFGKNRAALAAATSEAEAARADVSAARLSLSSAVVSAYADLNRLYAVRDNADAALKVRQQTFDLVKQRMDNGLETRGAFAQAASTVPAARQALGAADRDILLAKHRIAALTGQGPDRGLDIARPASPQLKAFGLPAGAGVDLIGRRPDIVAARLRAEAAASRITVAKADFYPDVKISAFYGLQAVGLGLLTDRDSQVGGIGPAIRLPIFNGKRVEASYRGSRAEYDAAVASYDAALTEALHEVADAVTSQRSLAAQIVDARQALSDSEEGARIEKLRYDGGLSPYLAVLNAETGVLENRRILAELQAQALSLDVALVRALGGGYVAS